MFLIAISQAPFDLATAIKARAFFFIYAKYLKQKEPMSKHQLLNFSYHNECFISMQPLAASRPAQPSRLPK